VVYSGDGAYIAAENEDMEYYTPEQGTNIWCDAMVIPKDASNPDLAHEFINFVLDNEENLSIVEEVGYTSTNQEVLDEVTAEGGAYEDNAAYVPRTDNDKDEVFHDNETIRKKLTDLWIKVKAAK
jgi:spermidine/putrescine-binding protein